VINTLQEATMKVEKITYGGWQNCYRLTNGVMELVVTADVGPRIIRCGFVGDSNVFKEYPEMLGRTGGDEWRIYGGHRLWHAPEARPRTYYPDNEPVGLAQYPDHVRVTQPTEKSTGIRKEMDITLSGDGAHVRVLHRLTNVNLWAAHLAPWALTVMPPGGTAILPLPPRGSHEANLPPTNSLTMWAYTDLSDPRWTWGRRYILLHQSPDHPQPQKLGVMAPDAWVVYVRDSTMFLKKFDYVAGATYPDMGATVETFTNAEMLELETLGPLAHLQPNASIEHVEHWYLYRGVPVPMNEADVDEHVLPKIGAAPREI
jgi:hypothetical protein